MGLMDILNGMNNGPRGARPGSADTGSSGMSPITMALLGLLAYKTLSGKGLFGGNNANTQAPAPGTPAPGAPHGEAGGGGLGGLLGGLMGGGAAAGQAGGGSLGGLLSGGLGGLLGGAAAGNVLSGGLGDLLKRFQQNGKGDVASSWVGSGPNKQISPDELKQALGPDVVNDLANQAGLSQVELLNGLSQQLPHVVDKLTPDGRVPTAHEASQMV